MKLIEKKDTNSILYALGLLIFFLFAFFTIGGEDGLIHLVQLKQTRDDFIQKNRALLSQNLSYQQEISKLRDLNYIEKRARKALGLVRSDETVYLLPHND